MPVTMMYCLSCSQLHPITNGSTLFRSGYYLRTYPIGLCPGATETHSTAGSSRSSTSGIHNDSPI